MRGFSGRHQLLANRIVEDLECVQAVTLDDMQLEGRGMNARGQSITARAPERYRLRSSDMRVHLSPNPIALLVAHDGEEDHGEEAKGKCYEERGSAQVIRINQFVSRTLSMSVTNLTGEDFFCWVMVSYSRVRQSGANGSGRKSRERLGRRSSSPEWVNRSTTTAQRSGLRDPRRSTSRAPGRGRHERR